MTTETKQASETSYFFKHNKMIKDIQYIYVI
jgi:hypothetical protein